MANPEAMNESKEDMLMWLVSALPIIIVFVIGGLIIVFVGLPVWNSTIDTFMPNGKTANVTILTVYMAHNILYDKRTCIYEVEGERHEWTACLYNEGDTVAAYETNGGFWYIEK